MNLFKKGRAGFVSAIMLSLSLGVEARLHNNTQDFSAYETENYAGRAINEMEKAFVEGEADPASSAEIEAPLTEEALADGFIFEDSDGNCQFLSIETKQVLDCDTQQRDLLYSLEDGEPIFEEIQIAGFGDWMCSPKEYLKPNRDEKAVWGSLIKTMFPMYFEERYDPPADIPPAQIAESDEQPPMPPIIFLLNAIEKYDSPAEVAGLAPSFAFAGVTGRWIHRIGMEAAKHVGHRALAVIGGSVVGFASFIGAAGFFFRVANASCNSNNNKL